MTEPPVPLIFDREHYDKLNASRAAAVGEVLSELKGQLGLNTAIDVGCGVGYFAAYLHSLGYQVTAVDGRQQNAEEAGRRVPGVRFDTRNVEDPSVCQLGRFDLVFCFGLLYHLENPFLAVRHLHTLTKDVLLVEGVIYPGPDPVMALVDEGSTDDQGLNHLAFYPTEACLLKLFYRAGFAYVYRFAKMPAHSDFHASPRSRRVRTMLAASRIALVTKSLEFVEEPHLAIQPWDPNSGAPEEAFIGKLKHFAQKPLPEKIKSLRNRLNGDLG